MKCTKKIIIVVILIFLVSKKFNILLIILSHIQKYFFFFCFIFLPKRNSIKNNLKIFHLLNDQIYKIKIFKFAYLFHVIFIFIVKLFFLTIKIHFFKKKIN